jgi:hypothetical protein
VLRSHRPSAVPSASSRAAAAADVGSQPGTVDEDDCQIVEPPAKECTAAPAANDIDIAAQVEAYVKRSHTYVTYGVTLKHLGGNK